MQFSKQQGERMSTTRKLYFMRLIGRIIIFILCIFALVKKAEYFTVLKGMNFFKKFSPLHVLWSIWVIDILFQLFPIGKKISIGSLKLFENFFQPVREKINYQALRKYVITTTKSAYIVFIIWALLILALGILFYVNIIDTLALFLISVFFYMCDLICVLIWCPFRLIMKNRCCTTCRIFNWDHIMMFSPLIFVGGFYAISLVLLSLIAWIVWELAIMMYPERFWEYSNGALNCAQCTDKLCTQYCKKLKQ